MNTTSAFNSSNKKHGQSMVEVAISLMIILWLLAAAVDFGMAFYSYVAIRDAAQEGALYGSLYPTEYDNNCPSEPGDDCCADNNCIENRIRQSSATAVDLSDTANVTIAISIPHPCAGNLIKVTVTYKYHITMPLTSTILGTSIIPIRASATTVVFRPPC